MARGAVSSLRGLRRPLPPAGVLDAIEGAFVAAPEVWAWAHATFIAPDAPLHNPDHLHLEDARVGVLWTNVEHTRQMRRVLGTAEIPQTMGGAWKRARAEQQIREWFGFEPDFLLTLSAPDAAEADDASFCALIEHELYHCAQAVDQWGEPRFGKDGRPQWAIRGHDVEEFVGVVRRYGVGAAAGDTAALVRAANKAPLFGVADIAGACGTCLRAVA